MNTPTDLAEVSITHHGVTFTITAELRTWVIEKIGASFWFSELESIAADIRSTLGIAHKVILYAVPTTERVYAKIVSPGTPWQQEWFLHFGEGGRRQFFKIR